MLECVMLIALAKIPARKRCDFARLKIKVSSPLHHSSPNHN